MASSLSYLTLLLRVSLWTVVLLISPAYSLTCTSQTFKSNNLYSHCLDLPTLNSYLHWTYDSSNSSISVAFIASSGLQRLDFMGYQPHRDWHAWSSGSRRLQAFQRLDDRPDLQHRILQHQGSAEHSNGVIRLFAKMKVPEKPETVNQVWQVGPIVGNVPAKHEIRTANLNAKATLSLTGTQTDTTTGVDSRTKRKNIHGILNAVSWGLLFPIGAIIARYLRTFQSTDPAWFYLHISCQISAYAIGVAGWGTGLKLGSESKGIQHTGHRNIGIALFSLATVQIFALFIRPKKEHKYRFYWNIYHHGLGYTILVLGILNVFKGLDILLPEKKWKSAYIIAIGVLGVIAVLLEAITWVVVLRRKSSKSTKPYDGFNNGQGRQQPLAI
ncbi:hypothetical protein FNV43_RR22996 [Rhamnella rubrinervis]|uniref:Cytochrome b561 and DOMON domain-containing protein n=1 Tax=Rhamnella rubrinervis TaxID=2594499 RepID=A0A8K0DXP0_9ROSA|nr:hypothetical protein FNV43_RR22996 [Rhamnella rubrinervis]